MNLTTANYNLEPSRLQQQQKLVGWVEKQTECMAKMG